MVTLDFSDIDWRYLSYPFGHAMTIAHPKAQEAFSGSNKGATSDSHFLYGFVNGATPKEMSVMGVRDGKDISEIQEDTKFDQVNTSNRALRDKLNRWRNIICSDVDYLTYVFRKILSATQFFKPIQIEFHQCVQTILGQGLFENIDSKSLSEREFIWAKAKDCFEQCPTSLTKFELAKKYNGKTTFNAHIVNWRMHLGELDMDTGFNEWLVGNQERLNSLFATVSERASKKEHCRFCHFPVCKSHSFIVTESVSFYLTKYRITTTKQFFQHYVMAIIFSILRMELIIQLQALQDLAEKKAVFDDEKKKAFESYKYTIDKNHQKFVNSICLAIVDCLLAEKSGEKSKLLKASILDVGK